MSLTTVLDQLKDVQAYPNGYYAKLPAALQLLVDAFAGHPFQVGAVLRQWFWNNLRFDRLEEGWLEVEVFAEYLLTYDYARELFLEYTVVAVEGTVVVLQAWKLTVMADWSMLREPMHVIKREVVEELEGGHCFYWIQLHEAVDFNGPQVDDQCRFSPEERLVIKYDDGEYSMY